MKKLRFYILLFIISIYCSSCAVVAITAAAGAVVLGIDLAGNAAKKGIRNSIANKEEGSITLSDIRIEKAEVDSSHVLKINGQLQIIPGTKNNERFRNLSSYYFVFLLYDNKSQLLKRVYQETDVMQGVDVSNVEVNKSYHITLRIEKLPSNIFSMLDNVKFEKASTNNGETDSKLLK